MTLGAEGPFRTADLILRGAAFTPVHPSCGQDATLDKLRSIFDVMLLVALEYPDVRHDVLCTLLALPPSRTINLASVDMEPELTAGLDFFVQNRCRGGLQDRQAPIIVQQA